MSSIVASSTVASSKVASSTTATPLTNLTVSQHSLTSSHKSTAVGAGVGVPLGLALLGALGLLGRQRSRELSARREVRVWKEKYDELRVKSGNLIGVEGQMRELGHEGGRSDELDGRLIYEVAERM